MPRPGERREGNQDRASKGGQGRRQGPAVARSAPRPPLALLAGWWTRRRQAQPSRRAAPQRATGAGPVVVFGGEGSRRPSRPVPATPPDRHPGPRKVLEPSAPSSGTNTGPSARRRLWLVASLVLATGLAVAGLTFGLWPRPEPETDPWQAPATSVLAPAPTGAGWGLVVGGPRGWLAALLDWLVQDPGRRRQWLAQALPQGVEVGPEPEPRSSWQEELRAWVFRLTDYDLATPRTLLEATVPGLQQASHLLQIVSRGSLASPRGDNREPTRSQDSLGQAGGSEARQGEPSLGPSGQAADVGRGAEGREPEQQPGAEAGEGSAAGQLPTVLPADRAARVAVLRRVPWGAQPLVAILHTHGSEMYRSASFRPGQADEYHRFNTTETGVMKVGRRLQEVLQERYGITSVHATNIHDYPRFSLAYARSLETATRLVQRYRDLQAMFDIHRDGVETRPVTVAGRQVARVVILVTTARKAPQYYHPHWEQNLAFARLLKEIADQRYPGLISRIQVEDRFRYNQHVHPHMLLLEVGSYNNREEEALASAELMADVLAEALWRLRTSAGTARAGE